MSKTSAKRKKSRPADTRVASDYVAHVMRIQPTRETVESIAVAVILAFVFRSFVAEAFVIPTGSMAPTLQGQHVDVVCPECKYQFRANASDEARSNRYTVEPVCPNCRHHFLLNRSGNANHRSFTGDRILVSKFAYELSDPKRWDVIVFKYPGNAKQNYIKRLVGLPNEMLRIWRGDLYVAKRLFEMSPSENNALLAGEVSEAMRAEFEKAGNELSADIEVRANSHSILTHHSQAVSQGWQIIDREKGLAYEVRSRLAANRQMTIEFFAPFRIARKPLRKAMAMLHLVYDTHYQAPQLKQVGWPSRWRSTSTANGWKTLDDNLGYQVEASENESMIRYRHIFPTQSQWDHIEEYGELPDNVHDGQLITDHYAYNDFGSALSYGRQSYDEDSKQGMNWVGDLVIETEVKVFGESGHLVLDLVKAGVHFTCRIDVGSGEATLSRSDQGVFGYGSDTAKTVTASTRVVGSGNYKLRFANVDDELRLWVNGDLAEFDTAPQFVFEDFGSDDFAARKNLVGPVWTPKNSGDFEPVGVGAQNLKAHFERLQLYRDIYYIATDDLQLELYESPKEIVRLHRSPRQWATSDVFSTRSMMELFVEADCFLPMGDNSPASSDARMWTDFSVMPNVSEEGTQPFPYFERELLIGKAVLIYWPHGWRTGIKVPIPNVPRMGIIR
ncbi:MAG: signal peptidase I [Pirellulaceae bacterium]|nr:signal peptidase I [Planctomycetaceae bacterium]HIM31215.1 signal peptidase I [Planctomycetota bacterium]